MIRDRGNIKWTAMMLPEHVKAIRDWLDSDGKIERPVYDEWELEAIQMEIELAFKRQCETKIEVWKAGRVDLYMGKICELDTHIGTLSVEGPFGHDRISVFDIVSVQCVD